MTKLQIHPTEEPGTLIVSGIVAADTDLSPLLESSAKHIILNLKGIVEITSIGVKKWVEGISQLQERGKTLEYQECPEVFVEQCNFVLELCQGVIIHSLQVSFICEDCEEYLLKTFKREDLDLDNLPPEILCPSCGEEMITEEGNVFDFLKIGT